jgi:DNA-binding PadR family transcriptional regulator
MDNELLLLGLLRLESMHGYQLNEFLDKRLGFVTDLKRSTAYYLLNKLEESGFITKEVEREGNRPERYVYELTETGRERFHDLLDANLRAAHMPYYNTDIGLLFIDAVPLEALQDALAEKRAGLVDMLDTVRSYVDEHPAGSPARYALRHNVVHLEAELDWLDRIATELAGRPIDAKDVFSCMQAIEEQT